MGEVAPLPGRECRCVGDGTFADWSRCPVHTEETSPAAQAVEIEDRRRPFFTPRTLAEYLALSERTVRQMLADRVIPSYRLEGSRRVAPEDVDAYVAARREAA